LNFVFGLGGEKKWIGGTPLEHSPYSTDHVCFANQAYIHAHKYSQSIA